MKKLSLCIIGAVIFTTIFLLNACSMQIPSNTDFDSAYFDVVTEDGAKVDIPQIIIRFKGKYNDINFDDFTDMILTRDGIPVTNKLTYNGVFFQGNNQTDFYFEFENENRKSGIYGFTGKYKDTDFEIYNKVVEETPLGDTPANPDDLWSVGCGGQSDGNGNLIEVSDIAFYFDGVQQAFFNADLTDLELTFKNQKIEFEFNEFDNNGRYLEIRADGKLITGFHLSFKEALTKSGVYQLTGNYRGKPFVSIEIIIK